MAIGDRIREARGINGMSAKELARQLHRSTTAICNYEKHSKGITAELISQLIDVLNVTPNYLFQDYFDIRDFDLDEDEINLLNEYRALDYQGKVVVRNNSFNEFNRVSNDLENSLLISRPYYKNLTSYYENNTLDAVVYRLKNTAENRKIDCIVKMYDDSMEPDFVKGSRLMVRKKDKVPLYGAGIFEVDGRILIRLKGKNKLYCNNSRYPDIRIDDRVRVLGRILGELNEHF